MNQASHIIKGTSNSYFGDAYWNVTEKREFVSEVAMKNAALVQKVAMKNAALVQKVAMKNAALVQKVAIKNVVFCKKWLKKMLLLNIFSYLCILKYGFVLCIEML